MTEENVSQHVQALHRIAFEILKVQEAALLRHDLGQLGFDDLKDDVKAIHNFCVRVTKCTWRGLPSLKLQNLHGTFETLLKPINAITTFKAAESQNFQHERNNLSAGLRNEWRRVYDELVHCNIDF